MSASWAKVGAKCVCVDYKRYMDPARFSAPQLPPKGIVVEVAAVGTDEEGRAIVYIKGFPNSSPTSRRDVGFLAARFRPLITRSQEDDVALFRKLLVTEGADA